MATYARWTRTITDDAGNVRNAKVYVYKESDGQLATIYSDRSGATPLANPFTLSNSDRGRAYFHAAGSVYEVYAVDGSWSQTWRYQALGTAAECDVGSFIGSGQAPAAVVTIAALKALSTAINKIAVLNLGGRSGVFVFLSGDYSAQVALDTQNGVFAKADDTSASAGAWVRSSTATLRAEMFGAAGDTQVFDAACSITSGAPNLTVTGATFTANDVGKKIVIGGAGTAGAPLATTIGAYVDATHVTLSANAATTLSASTQHVAYGTDDTTALQCYLNVCGYIGAPFLLGDSPNGYAISTKLQAKVTRDLRATDATPASDIHFTDGLPFLIKGLGKGMLVCMATMTAMLELIYDTGDSDLAPFYSVVENIQADGCDLATSWLYSNYAMHVITRGNRVDRVTRGIEYLGYGVALIESNVIRAKYGCYLPNASGDGAIRLNDFYAGADSGAGVYLGHYAGDARIAENVFTNEFGYTSAVAVDLVADGGSTAAEEVRHVVLQANEFCGYAVAVRATGTSTTYRNIFQCSLIGNHTNGFGGYNPGKLLKAQDCSGFQIIGNFCNHNALGDASAVAIDLTRCDRFGIIGNNFEARTLGAITLADCTDALITDNGFDDCGKGSSSTAVVAITGSSSRHNVVSNNRFRASSASYGQIAVSEGSGVDRTSAIDNMIYNLATPYSFVGANSFGFHFSGSTQVLQRNEAYSFSVNLPASLTGNRSVTWPDASITINAFVATLLSSASKVALQSAVGVREVLTGSRTYYVRTDGNDSNTGLVNNAGGAFLTIAKAISVVADTLDLAGNTVTIQLGDGTWTTPVSLTRRWVGGPPEAVTLQGNTSTPGNVTINTTSANALSISGPGVGITLAYMDVKTTTSGYGVNVEDGAKVVVGAGMRFGACVNAQIFARKNSIVVAYSNYTINGGAAQHVYIDTNAVLIAQSLTITLTGTPAFSGQFMFVDAGAMVVYNGHTFSGSATGARYSVTLNGAIQTFGGGATYLPGNSAGSTGTGGQYA